MSGTGPRDPPTHGRKSASARMSFHRTRHPDLPRHRIENRCCGPRSAVAAPRRRQAEAMAHAFSARTNVLLANAGRYRAQLQPGESKKRTGMVVVTCMDARFNVYALLGLNECDAHILRNAGGVVTDDVIRSLAISQRLFETTDVMVITHAACGLRDITDEQLTSAATADVGGRGAG